MPGLRGLLSRRRKSRSTIDGPAEIGAREEWSLLPAPQLATGALQLALAQPMEASLPTQRNPSILRPLAHSVSPNACRAA